MGISQGFVIAWMCNHFSDFQVLFVTNVSYSLVGSESVKNIISKVLYNFIMDVQLTLSVPIVLLNSPNLSPYFSLSKLREFYF